MSTSSSIPLDDAIEIIRKHAPDQAIAITRDLVAVQKELAAERAAQAGPKASTRLAIIIRGDAALKRAVAAGAYVLSVPDDDAVSNTYMGEALIQRITTAARAHNEAPRKRRSKSRRTIKTLNEAMTGLKAKIIKESGSTFSIKQKGVVAEVIVVEGEALPGL